MNRLVELFVGPLLTVRPWLYEYTDGEIGATAMHLTTVPVGGGPNEKSRQTGNTWRLPTGGRPHPVSLLGPA